MKSPLRKTAVGVAVIAVSIALSTAIFRQTKPDEFEHLAIKTFCPKLDEKFKFYPEYIDHVGSYQKGELQLYAPLPYLPEEWARLYDIDENGVVRIYKEEEKTYFYDVVTISQLALANFKKYVDTSEPRYKDAFLANSSYLKSHYQTRSEDEIAYPYEFSHGRLKPGWYSAMAQGQVISTLVLEYKLTREPSLLEHVRKVKNFMLRSMEDGGTLTKTPEGGLWLEEYAVPPADFVLNGAIFALVSLYDYLSVIPDDPQVKEILPQLLTSMKASVPLYDTGRWVIYDRKHGYKINSRYMEIHVLQMYQMYQVTGDPFYLDTYERWRRYYDTCVVDKLPEKHS